MRYGRGGQVFLNCRDAPQRLARQLSCSSLFDLGEENKTALNEDVEEAESQKRLEERWKFDVDDMLPVGPDGAEEHDRQLIDDYDTWCVFLVTLLSK